MTKLWFKRKTYGWGWTPSTWEGWAIVLGYVILITLFSLTIDENSPSREVLFTFLLPVIFLTITLIRICYAKGEKPMWVWGDKELISQGEKLAFKVFKGEGRGKRPGVLFIHGYTGTKEGSYQHAEALATIGYTSFLFDMRGHGESAGEMKKLSGSEFLKDVLAAYDFFVQTEDVDRNNISVIGTSLGSHMALLLSTKRKVKNLVVRAPSDFQDEVFDKPIEENGGWNPKTAEWRREVKTFSDSFALKAMHVFEGNTLVVESEKDDMVPHQTVLNYINAARSKAKLTHTVLKDAPHSLPPGKLKDELTQILKNWFKALAV